MQVVDWQCWSFWISFAYILIAIAAGFQLLRIVWYRHRLLSYQVFFLTLTFMWAVLRTIVFFLLPYWTQPVPINSAINIIFLILLDFPFILQFATFTLLVVFYASVVHKDKWMRPYNYRLYMLGCYAVANISFFLLILTSLILQIANNDSELASSLTQGFIGLIFLVLVFLLGVYGYFVCRDMWQEKISSPFHFKGFSNVIVMLATGVIVVIFACRAIYDFMTAANIGIVDVTCTGEWQIQIQLSGMYLFWDIIPAAIVIILFWHVPSARSVYDTLIADKKYQTKIAPVLWNAKGEEAAMDVNSSAEDIIPVNKISPFNDPLRYDSDEETKKLNSTVTPTIYGNLLDNMPLTPYSTTPHTTESQRFSKSSRYESDSDSES